MKGREEEDEVKEGVRKVKHPEMERRQMEPLLAVFMIFGKQAHLLFPMRGY